MADYPADQFRDSSSLTIWTLRLLYLYLAINVVSAWSGGREIVLLDDMARGSFDSNESLMAAAESNDLRQRVIAIANIAIFIASGVLSLRWIYVACHNARVRPHSMEITPGWAVGWYFIPLATWWVPFQAMREIWKATADHAGRPLAAGKGLLGTWWTFWIVSNFSAQVALRFSLGAHQISELQLASKMMLITHVLNVLLTIFFIQLVRQLSAMQEFVRSSPPLPDSGGSSMR